MIKNIVEKVDLRSLKNWLSELPDFYFRPSAFFPDFFVNKPNRVVAKQALFYVLLFLGIIWIINGFSATKTAHDLLLSFGLSIVLILFILPAHFMMKTAMKHRVNFVHSVSFVVVSRLCVSALIIGVMNSYIKTESVETLLFANTLSALCLFFIVFYSNKIFYGRYSYFIAGFLLNIVFVNLFVFGVLAINSGNPGMSWIFTTIDKEIDPISYEYKQAEKHLKTIDGPFYGLSERQLSQSAIPAFYDKTEKPVGELNHDNEPDSTLAYIKNTQAGVGYLLDLRNKSTFEKNRKLFGLWAAYLKNSLADYADKRTDRPQTDRKVLDSYLALTKAQQEYQRDYALSTAPYVLLGTLFSPAVHMAKKYKLIDSDSVSSYARLEHIIEHRVVRHRGTKD